MKKNIYSFLCLTLLILGGCQMNDKSKKTESESMENAQEELLPQDMAAEDLPKVEAFQDEFTRSFLQSTEETRLGYYPFLSNTGAFEMDFPEDGENLSKFYYVKKNSSEILWINVGDADSAIVHNIQMNYTGHLTEEIHKESDLRILRKTSGEDLEFERIEQENQIIYIGPYALNSDGPGGSESYGYGALIFNKLSPGGIQVRYDANCMRECGDEREKDQAAIYDWILNGIRFVDSNEVGEEGGE